MSLVLVTSTATADAVRDANRLLKIADLGSRFETRAMDQTHKIIRTYSSIVNMSASIILPQKIKNSIANCYAEAYSWQRFAPGIAKIFADNLSQKELRLLINFYSNLGLSPTEIDTFKTMITKANQIERISIEYIFKNSESCVQRDAELINKFIANHEITNSNQITIQ